MQNIDDKDIYKRLLNGDESALVEVIDCYGSLVKKIITYKLNAHKDLQDECLNDVFLAIWTNISSYDYKKSNLKNWIIGITRYKTVDYLRKIYTINKNHCLSKSTWSNENLSYTDENLEKIHSSIEKELEQILSPLSEMEKEIFISRYLEGASIDEISVKSSLTSKEIYNKLFYSKKKIKRKLKNVVNFRRITGDESNERQ